MLIGYLGDLIIVPLGLALVLRLTPPAIIQAAQFKADQTIEKPVSYASGVVIIFIWLVLSGIVLHWCYSLLA